MESKPEARSRGGCGREEACAGLHGLHPWWAREESGLSLHLELIRCKPFFRGALDGEVKKSEARRGVVAAGGGFVRRFAGLQQADAACT